MPVVLDADESLRRFHPLLQEWFAKRFAAPTAAQKAAWPLIAAGAHVLVTAPTGSGKTLTAFFYALDSLLTGQIDHSGISVLYISPLKALNNDIERNLTAPLRELSGLFESAGLTVPDIRVMTRSGDTPEDERRRMSTHPPSILITTPESLNILITSKRGEQLLHNLKTVILDEIHAVADSKRGTYLMTAVERLTRLSGEFQRIALTATVNPIEEIARFVGGYEQIGSPNAPTYRQRKVHIVAPNEEKSLTVAVRFAPPVVDEEETSEGENPGWIGAATDMAGRISHNNATLVFANSRRGVERLSRLINEACEDKTVWAHHGSLSKEIRLLVEERLKAGELKGVVATSSLELGIDIGHIDEVLMLETPPSAAAALQRLGRSGHRVGETSRGILYVLYPEDALDAAIVAKEAIEKHVEPIRPPEAPLDVLAQVILSICSREAWSLDALYQHILSAAPYRHLSRRMFDLVVEMLAGKYAGAKVDALKPRLVVDRVDNAARTLPNATKLLYRSGGTIPDRGYYAVRLKETGALIGELDEEFVWERKLGDIITLGVQTWRISDITYNDVLVIHHGTKSAQTPFWRCEERGSSAYLADIKARFLEAADEMLEQPAFTQRLVESHFMDSPAADMVRHYLKAEKVALGVPLPHRHHLVIERVAPGLHGGRMGVTVLHTQWGGKVNRPLAEALNAALSSRLDQTVLTAHDNGTVAVAVEAELEPEMVLGLVTAENAESLIRTRIEQSGFFGAAFRENAARALLILRAGFGKRTPLWLNRKRAKEIRERVAPFEDFPITLETFRTVLQDESDIEALKQRLDELDAGAVSVSVVETPRPSPFAESVVYKLTNELMYDDDAVDSAESATNDMLIEEVLFSEPLRPRFEAALIDTLQQKLTRLYPGYAPGSALELLSWLDERILIPFDEWDALLSAMKRDHGVEISALLEEIAHRVLCLDISRQERKQGRYVTTVGHIPWLRRIFDLGDHTLCAVTDPTVTCSPDADAAVAKLASSGPSETETLESFLSDWLKFYGPLSISALSDLLPVSRARLLNALALLQKEGEIVIGRLSSESKEEEAAHAAVLRMLLRAQRAEGRRSLSPRPPDALPLFIAETQGLTDKDKAAEPEGVLETLFGFAAPPSFFEQELLPARDRGYRTASLDALLAGSNLQWVGAGKDRVFFCLEEERALFDDRAVPPKKAITEVKEIFPDDQGRYTVSHLEKRSGIPGAALRETLRKLAEKGLVTSDTFHPLRSAAAASKRPAQQARPRLSKWKRAEPDLNVFYPLPTLASSTDALDEEELNRERVRTLLRRYGIVFKQLLEREMPLLRWSGLFRTLRLMELSQEVIGGYFFEGIPGIQFIAPSAVSRLQRAPSDQSVFWFNAKDPASLCGVGLTALNLPPRVASTHLVYRGTTLVIVSKRNGKHIEIRMDSADPGLERCLDFIDAMLKRDVSPVAILTIEKINGKSAAQSPYRRAFEKRFDTATTHRTLTVSKRLWK